MTTVTVAQAKEIISLTDTVKQHRIALANLNNPVTVKVLPYMEDGHGRTAELGPYTIQAGDEDAEAIVNVLRRRHQRREAAAIRRLNQLNAEVPNA